MSEVTLKQVSHSQTAMKLTQIFIACSLLAIAASTFVLYGKIHAAMQTSIENKCFFELDKMHVQYEGDDGGPTYKHFYFDCLRAENYAGLVIPKAKTTP